MDSGIGRTREELAQVRESGSKRFDFHVVLEASAPSAGGLRITLQEGDVVVLGRGRIRAVRREGKVVRIDIPSEWLSREHLRVTLEGGALAVEDCQSRNGTFVEGRRLDRFVLLPGRLLEAGRVFCTLRASTVPPLAPGLAPDMPLALRTWLPDLEQRFEELARIAKSRVPVLVLGPTGSGKELVGRAIHEASGRPGPFVAVNCGALPALLVESLLFGHTRGAFSGAIRDELGFVRSAQGGTLFLDEIGDLPLSAQATLLRVLQEGEVTPVGAARPVPVDVRVVSATHRPLAALSLEGRFRSDLLARLDGYSTDLPPLAARREDLGALVARLLERCPKPPRELSVEAARALLHYDWPLNVRELEQSLAAATVLADGGVLTEAMLPLRLQALGVRPSGGAAVVREAAPLDPAEQALRDELVRCLSEHAGNVAAVARAMGKAPNQVHRWMRRFGVTPTTFRPPS